MPERDGYHVYVGLGVPGVCVAVLYETNTGESFTDLVDTRHNTHTKVQESPHMYDRRDAWVPDMNVGGL